MAHKLETFTAKDFINLTFCCQEATVITDFSDLESVGKAHYLALYGGMASTDELAQVDGVETALLLIENGNGVITPYGVVYDNGMKLEELYDGKIFPNYEYGDTILILTMSDQTDTMKETYLYLPMPESKVERILHRAGIQTYEDIRLHFASSALPKALEDTLNVENENLFELNDMARSVIQLGQADQTKLGAVVEWLKPGSAEEITNLAAQLELFDFVPAVSNVKEYGRYMIMDSGHFEYDENLDEFYDFERYGRQRMDSEQGAFTSEGYVSYQGERSLDELLAGSTEEAGFQMGGIR